MATYNLDAQHHPYQHEEQLPDAHTMESLWKLFVEIGRFWKNNDHPEECKSNFLVFITNRIQVNPGYVNEYRNAAEVIAEEDLASLCKDVGEKAVFSGDPTHQISEQYYWHGGGRPIVIADLDSASRAIDVIKDQGEGAAGSLFDGDKQFFGQPAEVAHYFRFNEIYKQRHYKSTDKVHDEPSGDALQVNYEQVFPIKNDPEQRHGAPTFEWVSPALS